MRVYHSPKDYLDAARDPATAPEELRQLARSEYDFVQRAVAAHPSAEGDVFTALVPQRIASGHEELLAWIFVQHPRVLPEHLRVLAEGLPYPIDRGREHHNVFYIGLAVCNHPKTPLDAIQSLLTAGPVSSAFRRKLARATMRADVLQLLLADHSAVVRRWAQARLVGLMEAQSGSTPWANSEE